MLTPQEVQEKVFPKSNGLGGGYQTMAAAQIKDSSIESVAEELMHKIEKYNEK